MELLEPIMFTNYSEQLVGQMKPSEIILLMKTNGWTNEKLKHQFNWDIAVKELKKQVKWN